MGLCQFLRAIKLKFLADAIIAVERYLDFLRQKIEYDGLKKTIGDGLFLVENGCRRLIRRIRLKGPRKFLPECVLVAGPFIGELGFEVCEWAPHIKSLADFYKCRVHVFTKNGHESLYPFAEEVRTFDFPNPHVEKNWLLNPPKEEVDRYNALEIQARKYAKELRTQGRCVIVEHCGYSRLETIFNKKSAVLLESVPELTEEWEKRLPETKKIVLTCRAYARGTSRNSDIDLLNRLGGFIKERGWAPIIVGRTDEGFSVPEDLDV